MFGKPVPGKTPSRIILFPGRACLLGALLCLLALSPAKSASPELLSLSLQQDLVTLQIEQSRRALDKAQQKTGASGSPEDPTVQELTAKLADLEQQLTDLRAREQALLEKSQAVAAVAPANEPPAARTDAAEQAIESKPLRSYPTVTPEEQDAAEAAHLRHLLARYEEETATANLTQPTAEEISAREAARRDAQHLARIPFNPGKVRLNGAEGSAALAEITDRLADPAFAESRRDVAPICSIRTRLVGKLIASEQRSLRPVGKHHYVARLRLQPGDTTIAVQGDRWELRLPDDINSRDYLLTLYRPPGQHPQLHVFAVEDLLAEEAPHIPAWLPREIKLAQKTQ